MKTTENIKKSIEFQNKIFKQNLYKIPDNYSNIDWKMRDYDIVNQYALSVTYKCNWFCNYCIVNTHNRKDIDFEVVLKKIDKLPYHSFISITGGEPGMLSEEKINIIIKKLREKDCYIRVNTNGLFFKYTEIIPYIDSFGYHCSEDLDNDIIIPKVPAYKVTYIIVVTNENIHRLTEFLQKNKPIKFLVMAAAYNGANGKILSTKNILKIVKNHINDILPYSIYELFNRPGTAPTYKINFL